jgi:hypothetical protein
MPLPFPQASDPVTLAALAALTLLAAVALFLKSRKPWLSHIQRKPLLTPNEAEFFRRPRRALPDYAVFPQVAFAALLTDDGRLSGSARWSVRARFDKKIADFVICDRQTLQVLALVELDDRTHNAAADRQRDAITKAAGDQTLRFPSKQKPRDAEIAELFRHARAWTS